MAEDVFFAAVWGMVAFVATNLDDLAVLTAYLVPGRVTLGQAIRGQMLGMGLVMALSAAAALGTALIPPVWLHWIGLLPLAIGIKQLAQVVRRQVPGAGAGRATSRPARNTSDHPARRWSSEATVALLVVANGGDNVGVYTALFASQSWTLSATQIAIALILAVAWAWLAAKLVAHPTLGAPLRRAGPWLLPWVLIGLGVGILFP